jgi:hypothetical protein
MYNHSYSVKCHQYDTEVINAKAVVVITILGYAAFSVSFMKA